MKLRSLPIYVLLATAPTLAGCNGGSTSIAPVPSTSGSPTAAPTGTPSPSATSTTKPTATPTTKPTATPSIAPTATPTATPTAVASSLPGYIYAVNAETNAVLVYAPKPAGTLNEAPIGTISGSKTGLNSPRGVAVDASGRIYVANGSTNGSITVYPANPRGTVNEAPLATISGSASHLLEPVSIALDKAGNIYVSNFPITTKGGNSFVTVYPANPVGAIDEAPIGTINQLTAPVGISVDSSGKIYVSDQDASDIFIFAANPRGTISASPIASILSDPSGVAFDSTGRIYASENDYYQGSASAVSLYAANPSGGSDVHPALATIAGSNTGLGIATSIALDARGEIYVMNASTYGCCGAGSITVYAPNPSGTLNEAPLATIAGSNTGLSGTGTADNLVPNFSLTVH